MILYSSTIAECKRNSVMCLRVGAADARYKGKGCVEEAFKIARGLTITTPVPHRIGNRVCSVKIESVMSVAFERTASHVRFLLENVKHKSSIAYRKQSAKMVNFCIFGKPGLRKTRCSLSACELTFPIWPCMHVRYYRNVHRGCQVMH